MAYRYHGRASVNPSSPDSFAVCDRCGIWNSHSRMQWQFDYRGSSLQNLRILVCERCLDKPSIFYAPIITPPDPLPIQNPRPEWFALDENNYRTTQDGNMRVTQDDSDRVVNGGGNQVGEEPL